MNKIFGFLLLLPMMVWGQDFEVAPIKLNFNADPGESQTRVVTVKNHSSKRSSFILSMGDYRINSKFSK